MALAAPFAQTPLQRGLWNSRNKEQGISFLITRMQVYKNIFFAIYFKMKNSKSIKFKILYTIN